MPHSINSLYCKIKLLLNKAVSSQYIQYITVFLFLATAIFSCENQLTTVMQIFHASFIYIWNEQSILITKLLTAEKNET